MLLNFRWDLLIFMPSSKIRQINVKHIALQRHRARAYRRPLPSPSTLATAHPPKLPPSAAPSQVCVARAIGRPDAGKRLVEAMPVATSIERAANGAPPRGILLLGLRAGAPVAAGRETSEDGLLRMAGAENQLAAMDGWKPISVEAMAAARPDFIVITDRGLREARGIDALLAHPALRLTPAAQTRRVIAMDGMAMLGFGPRTLTAADELRAALEDVP